MRGRDGKEEGRNEVEDQRKTDGRGSEEDVGERGKRGTESKQVKGIFSRQR